MITQQQDLEISFKIYGCYEVNSVKVKRNSLEWKEIATTGRCNFNPNGKQSSFIVKLDSSSDTLQIEAIVDQEFGKSIDASDVQPANHKNDP